MSTGMAGAAIGCEDRLDHNPALKQLPILFLHQVEESITAGWPNAWAVFPLAKEVYSEDCPTEKKVEE